MNNTQSGDTIAAISTPLGEAGIGIVRLSGPDSLKIADKIFRSVHDKSKPSKFLSYTVHYGFIVEKEKKIDEVILTVMRAPKTYTREDVVEINCHAGIAVLKKIFELVLQEGARAALPGEFTKRAFLNGRIDLVQAEAVCDIINAKTNLSLKAAFEQLEGGLSFKIKKIRAEILDLIAYCEALIDFPEEDLKTQSKNISERIKNVLQEFEELISSFENGRILREGISAAIIGRPNAGKSSFLNVLLGCERAIVTSVPGTTTDTIEESINIDGARIKIIDTAGISLKNNKKKKVVKNLIEKQAFKRTEKALENSEVIIFIMDSSKLLTREDKIFLKEIEQKKAIIILNKIDLPRKIIKNNLKKISKKTIVEISAKKNINIEKARKAISDIVWKNGLNFENEIVVTNIRHKELLFMARKDVYAVSVMDSVDLELIVEGLRESAVKMGEITGQEIDDDILKRIFKNFCIGK